MTDKIFCTDFATCHEHARNPLPGDYWSDHLCPVCVVITTFANLVVICKTRKPVDSEHWTWDLTKLDTMKRHEFTRFLGNKHISGYWAEVSPQRHMWVVKALEEMNAFPSLANTEDTTCE